MMLKYGSLFTGIGGLDLGLERAGLSPAFQVEISPFCRTVLSRQWPHVPRFEDVREVGSHGSRAHDLPPCDVLCGGFPCQDLSNAGRRAGMDGARSGLWREFARLISELEPSYVVIENVAALLQSNNRFDIVLRDLAACRMDAFWSVLSSAAFGAPHLRERVFVIAYRRSLVEDSALADPGRFGCGDGLSPQLLAPLSRAQFPAWTPEEPLECVEVVGRAYPGLPSHLRVDDGLAARLDSADRLTSEAARQEAFGRVHGCGNAVSPQAGEYIGRWLVNFHERFTR